jgi:K+-sensing histidine kinase KdpD
MQATANKTTGCRVIGLEQNTTVAACGVMSFQSDKVGVSKHSCSGMEGTANPVLRFAKLMAISSEKRGDMHEQKYRKRVSKAGQNLRRTIDTMLDLVDAGCDDFYRNVVNVPIAGILDRVVDFLKPKSEACSIVVTIVLADFPLSVIRRIEQRLKGAIFNAVDKAIKHATCETNYIVKIHCLLEKHIIYVSDIRKGMNERGSNAGTEFFDRSKRIMRVALMVLDSTSPIFLLHYLAVK